MAWTYVGTDEPRANFVPPPNTPDTFSNPGGPFLNPGQPNQPGTPPPDPTLRYANPPADQPPLRLEIAPLQPNAAAPASALPPEADALYSRVRQAEGTAGGNGFVYYGGQSFTPGKDFPEWQGVMGPQGMTHAAGPPQWQPGTWNGLKPDFQSRFGREPDFSSDADQKAMTWLNAAKYYPGGEAKMRADIAAGKLDTAALSSQWRGFSRGSGGGWSVVGVGNHSVSPEAIAAAQASPDTDVVWMSPGEYKGLVQPGDEPEDRARSRSLDKSLASGDHVNTVPEITVKNGRVVDQDGWRRAQALEEAGVTEIPVAVHGASKDTKWLTDMGGRVHRFDFQPVPIPQGYSQRAPLAGPYGNQPVIDRDHPGPTPAESIIAEMAQKVGEIAELPVGIVERAGAGAWNAASLITGAKPYWPQIPIEPGLRDLGDIATFMTGGLMNPIGAEARAAGQAGTALSDVGSEAARVLPAPMSKPVANFLSDVSRSGEIENQARNVINQRYGQDLAAGGAAPADVARQLAAGRGEGLTLADVGGENMRALLGSAAREPGAGRNIVKQWAVGRLGDIDRDSPLAANIEKGIEETLATGSARTEARALAEQRAASKPLWDKAMAGGSIAPLESQFTAGVAEAGRVAAQIQRDIGRIENEVTQAAARQSQAGNVYSTSAANRARRFADDKIKVLREHMNAALAEKDEALARLRRAQADGTANTPGAVWSSYIGRLLTNPVVKSGINRGYAIERNIADGENRHFNPREYAVVGHEANGDPIVGSVPNMKLLAVAKEGMDAMLESDVYKDALTGRLNKAGRAVKILRDGLLNEVDRLNPAYKPARDKWAGDSALISAIRDGKNFHKQSPEEIREWFANAADSEKDFYRLGAADTIRDDLQRKVFGGDPSKAIINSPRARNQLMPMFRSPADANSFIERVRRARQMFETPSEVLRGSPTAARAAEDLARRQGMDTAADLLHGIISGASGHVGGAGYRAARIAHRYFNPMAQSPEREMAINAAIARLLTQRDLRVGTGEQLLHSIPLPATQNMLQRLMLRSVPAMFRQQP